MDYYHIIGVTESWLQMSNRDFIAEFKLPGYAIFSFERENRNGRGVIYIHSTLHPISVKTETVTKVDTVFIEIKNKSSNVII